MLRCAPSGLFIALLVGGACAPPIAATPYPSREPEAGEPSKPAPPSEARATQSVVSYFEREIDLGPLLDGFPYGSFFPNLETGELFFVETGRSYTLKRLSNLDASTVRYDLTGARTISEVDWSKRSLWDVRRSQPGADLWLHADAKNDERMNLWSLGGDELKQVTDYDYVYSFGLDRAGERVAYLPRHGTKAPYRTCLHVLSARDGHDEKVLCDDRALQFTWGEMVFSPDGSAVYFTGQLEGDRRRKQIIRLDLTANGARPSVVTDRKKTRATADLLPGGWLGEQRLVFIADDSGFDNLHVYDRARDRVIPLTRFGEGVRSARLTEAGIVAVHGTPAGSTLVLVDPSSGTVAAKTSLRGTANVIGSDGRTALVHHESPDLVFELLRVQPQEGQLEIQTVVAVDSALEGELVRCRSERVEIPTFDVDPATGKTRRLHAFLLEPENPVPPGQRLALIRAFYGGTNAYDAYDHVLCAAGLTVLSPAVRGSDGFGQSFSALNDEDLGGAEIVDLFHAARWLERRTGLGSERIGVYGRSHGGYATLRALTFPEATQTGEVRYPFGFGIAEAAFTSIESFHAATNIPDWVVRESGDPSEAEDLQRMRDRSPITHPSRLSAPVLLIHGSADWRVPVEESRRFVAAARDLGKPVQYVEVAGQGHHIEGLELQVEAYRARLAFLRAVAEAAPRTGAAPPDPAKPQRRSRPAEGS